MGRPALTKATSSYLRLKSAVARAYSIPLEPDSSFSAPFMSIQPQSFTQIATNGLSPLSSIMGRGLSSNLVPAPVASLIGRFSAGAEVEQKIPGDAPVWDSLPPLPITAVKRGSQEASGWLV